MTENDVIERAKREIYRVTWGEDYDAAPKRSAAHDLVDAEARVLAAAGLLAQPDPDMRRMVAEMAAGLAEIAEVVGLPRDTAEPEVIVNRVRERLARAAPVSTAPVPAGDEAAYEARVQQIAEVLRVHQYDEGYGPDGCFCGNQMGDQEEHQAMALIQDGIVAVAQVPANDQATTERVSELRLRLVAEQAADIDSIVTMVETQLADDLHDDQCHCDNYPAACESGMTRDSLAMASHGPEATILTLKDLGLLTVPAGDKTARCPICEHTAEFHQLEGCWFTVSNGKPGRDLVCPCEVSRAALAAMREQA